MINPESLMALSFQPTVWLENLLSELFTYPVQGVLFNNYFIALKKNPLMLSDGVCSYEVKETDYYAAEDSLLLKNNIIFGALHTQKINCSNYSLIPQAFLRAELVEISRALACITHHLKNRKSQQKFIAEHSVVQDLLSQIIVRISTLNTLIDSFSQTEVCADDLIVYAKNLIVAVCLDLGKLQGGQAFLLGGMSEMLWFFQNIHAIYLS